MNEHPNNPKTFKPSYGNHTSLADSRGEKKGTEEGEKGRGEKKRNLCTQGWLKGMPRAFPFPKREDVVRAVAWDPVLPSGDVPLLATGNGCKILG